MYKKEGTISSDVKQEKTNLPSSDQGEKPSTPGGKMGKIQPVKLLFSVAENWA